jgi:hypothetical protein
MTRKTGAAGMARGTATGVDRRAAEALALEVRMLARAHGLQIESVEVLREERTVTAKRRRVPERSRPSARARRAASMR